MVEIDHICLGVQHLFEGAYRLRNETGFGDYEGGWFPQTSLANRIVPLGDDTYIEVEAVVDAYQLRAAEPVSVFFDACVQRGDAYVGWCVRVASREELDRVARRLHADVVEHTLKLLHDGQAGAGVARVPDAISCWAAGKPNFFYFPDMTVHGSRQIPTTPIRCSPQGLAWMEVGGTVEEMSDWLGISADMLPLRFNGAAAGLYAVAVNTAEGERVIRRRNHRDLR